MIIIPNAKLTADNIINYSTTGTRRLDFVFGIGYTDDIDKAKGIIMEILNKDTRVLRDTATSIGLVELADSSVNIAARPWVNSSDYRGLHVDVLERVKKCFDARA